MAILKCLSTPIEWRLSPHLSFTLITISLWRDQVETRSIQWQGSIQPFVRLNLQQACLAYNCSRSASSWARILSLSMFKLMTPTTRSYIVRLFIGNLYSEPLRSKVVVHKLPLLTWSHPRKSKIWLMEWSLFSRIRKISTHTTSISLAPYWTVEKYNSSLKHLWALCQNGLTTASTHFKLTRSLTTLNAKWLLQPNTSAKTRLLVLA